VRAAPPSCSRSMLWSGGNALDALGAFFGMRTINECPQMAEAVSAAMRARQAHTTSELTSDDWAELSTTFAQSCEGSVDVFFALPFVTTARFRSRSELEKELQSKIFFTHELPAIVASGKVSVIRLWGIYGFTQMTNEEVVRAKLHQGGSAFFQQLMSTRRPLGHPVRIDSVDCLASARDELCRHVVEFFRDYDSALDANPQLCQLAKDTFASATTFATESELNGAMRVIDFGELRAYTKHLTKVLGVSDERREVFECSLLTEQDAAESSLSIFRRKRLRSRCNVGP